VGPRSLRTGRVLARVVTVAAVVAGLVVLIVPLCSDGMSMMPVAADVSATNPIGEPHDPGSMLASSGDSCAPGAADPAVAWCGPGAMSLFSSSSGSSSPGVGLLVCVAFAIAVLALAFGLQRPWSARAGLVRRAAEARLRLRGCPARRPALVELCVLRT
jgi:hypothetical protein